MQYLARDRLSAALRRDTAAASRGGAGTAPPQPTPPAPPRRFPSQPSGLASLAENASHGWSASSVHGPSSSRRSPLRGGSEAIDGCEGVCCCRDASAFSSSTLRTAVVWSALVAAAVALAVCTGAWRTIHRFHAPNGGSLFSFSFNGYDDYRLRHFTTRGASSVRGGGGSGSHGPGDDGGASVREGGASSSDGRHRRRTPLNATVEAQRRWMEALHGVEGGRAARETASLAAFARKMPPHPDDGSPAPFPPGHAVLDEHVASVRDHGAIGDGRVLNAAAVDAALEQCKRWLARPGDTEAARRRCYVSFPGAPPAPHPPPPPSPPPRWQRHRHVDDGHVVGTRVGDPYVAPPLPTPRAFVYLCAPIELPSHVWLKVDPGAVVSFAWDESLYATLKHPAYPARAVLRPPPFGARRAMIASHFAVDVGVTGGGVVEGNGRYWQYRLARKAPECASGGAHGSGSVLPGGGGGGARKRRRVTACRNRLTALREPPPPPVMSFVGCKGVTVRGVAVRHAPQRGVHLAHTTGADVEDVFVEGGDGVVVDGSRGVRVTNARLKVRSTAALVRAGNGGAESHRSPGVPVEAVTFEKTAVVTAAVGYKLHVQAGGTARGVRFTRAALGGEVPSAGASALTGYGGDEEARRAFVGPDIFAGALGGRGGVGMAAAVEVEAGGTLRRCGILHVRGAHLPSGGLSLAFGGGEGVGTVGGVSAGWVGAVVRGLDIRDVSVTDVGGVGLRLETGRGADVTGLHLAGVAITAPRGKASEAQTGERADPEVLPFDEGDEEDRPPSADEVEASRRRRDAVEALAGVLPAGGDDPEATVDPPAWGRGDDEAVVGSKDEGEAEPTVDPRADDGEVPAGMACAGTSFGAQDEASSPRLPPGCLAPDRDGLD